MCQFFSFVGDGYGNFRFSDWTLRQKLMTDKSEDSPDSHTFILRDVSVNLQDRWSRYEFNPWTKDFTVDQGVEGHNHKAAEKWVRLMDWSMVAPIVIKPIVSPLSIKPPKLITEEHIELLKEWDSLWGSLGASLGDSLRGSLGASLWDSLRDSLRDSLGDSLWDSLWDSLGAGLWDSLWDSLWASLWAYAHSFTTLEQVPGIAALNELWSLGLVPSYDGNTWRIHGGNKAKKLWEAKI